MGNSNSTPTQLERMYGYFRCPQCRKTWESSHVYCTPGTQEAVYGQECKSCRVMCKPNKVARLACPRCGLLNCNCPDRNIDINKVHRGDLCEKCRAGLPCAKLNQHTW